MVNEDAAAAHKLAHAGCHDEDTRCDCEYCVDGACLKDNVYLEYQGVATRVLCPKANGATDFAHACIKGTCNECGWLEAKSVELDRTVANRLKFDHGFLISTDTDTATLNAFRKLGVDVGWRPVHVTPGGGGNPRRVTTKTGYSAEVKPRRGDDTSERACTIRFERPGVIRDGDSMAFARCPRFISTDVDGVTMRAFDTMKVRRAKPSRTEDDEVLWDREVQVVQEKLVDMKELSSHLVDTSTAFFEHSWIAHHQAAKFDECLDGLPTDSIAILMDFSMVTRSPTLTTFHNLSQPFTRSLTHLTPPSSSPPRPPPHTHSLSVELQPRAQLLHAI